METITILSVKGRRAAPNRNNAERQCCHVIVYNDMERRIYRSDPRTSQGSKWPVDLDPYLDEYET